MSLVLPTASRAQRNLIILLGSLLVIAALLRSAPQDERPYDLDAATPQGLLALRMWLEEMGYTVTRLDRAPAGNLNGDLLFIFPTQRPYTPEAAQAVADWVHDGGVLVLIGPLAHDRALADIFGVRQAADFALISHMRQRQPILPTRPARWTAPGRMRGLDLTDAPAALPVLEGEPATTGSSRASAALQPWGAGLVWHLDTTHDFTNDRLRNLDQAALVPAILRLTPPDVPGRATVLIDVYHLLPPVDEGEIASLRDWLYGTRWGLAFLLLCGATLAYLALQGIRLGPPLREESLQRNREAAEYVAAMAGLYQRGNRRDTVARHMKRRLKAQLGHALRISPDEPDTEFLRQLREAAPSRHPRLSAAQLKTLASLLARLEQPLDDAALLDAAQETDELLQDGKVTG